MTLDKTLIRRLQEVAKNNDRSVSWTANEAIKKYLQSEKTA
jgi:predicted transcriptional regulator